MTEFMRIRSERFSYHINQGEDMAKDEDGCKTCAYYADGTCENEESEDFELEVDDDHLCSEHEPLFG
jgi:hypothetical protein